MSEAFGFIDRFTVVDACFESEDNLDEVHDLDETPLEGSCDVFIHEESSILDFSDIVLPNPLYHSMFPLSICYPLISLSIMLIGPLIIL